MGMGAGIALIRAKKEGRGKVGTSYGGRTGKVVSTPISRERKVNQAFVPRNPAYQQQDVYSGDGGTGPKARSKARRRNSTVIGGGSLG